MLKDVTASWSATSSVPVGVSRVTPGVPTLDPAVVYHHDPIVSTFDDNHGHSHAGGSHGHSHDHNH